MSLALEIEQSPIAHLGELDQISHALERPEYTIADYAIGDLWNVVDGYTNPKPPSDEEALVYRSGVIHMEDTAARVGEILSFANITDNEGLYRPNLTGALFSILEQCGVEYETRDTYILARKNP